MNTRAFSNRLASPMILGLLLSLPLISCNKREPTAEPLTTYKYDPLKEVAAKEKAAKEEKEKAVATVLDKAKKSREPSSVKAAPIEKTYVVQIGAFTKKENADQLLKLLETKNYPAFIKTLDHKTHGPMYLVRLKPMKERSEAEMHLSMLKESEKLEPVIIVPGYMKPVDERIPAAATAVTVPSIAPAPAAAAPSRPSGKAL